MGVFYVTVYVSRRKDRERMRRDMIVIVYLLINLCVIVDTTQNDNQLQTFSVQQFREILCDIPRISHCLTVIFLHFSVLLCCSPASRCIIIAYTAYRKHNRTLSCLELKKQSLSSLVLSLQSLSQTALIFFALLITVDSRCYIY